MSDLLAEIDQCEWLFLRELRELGRNSLLLVVEEGLITGDPEPIEINGINLGIGSRIEPTSASRAYELVWEFYIAYSVLNESYASCSEEERSEGRRFRLYSRSHFLEYTSRATFASIEHPGPSQHYSVACEDHIVNVLSTDPPRVRRVR